MLVKRRVSSRALFVSIALLMLTLLPLMPSTALAARDTSNPHDFFGIVGQDPWYQYNADPANFPNGINQTFDENFVSGIATLGAGWVRIEFHAEYDEPSGPGRIDYSKFDWFINTLAPKYHIKVLAVLGTGILGDLDPKYQFQHINDKPDASGNNYYSQAFVQRTKEIVDHYGDNVAAYEILNEPNANVLLDQETSGRQQAVNPTVYGKMMTDIYRMNKAAHPNVQFVAGSLLHEKDTSKGGALGWMTSVYQSPAVRAYVKETGHTPDDAIAIHPYYLDPQDVLAETLAVHNLQKAQHDNGSVWITEIGMAATPPDWSDYGIMDPTASEVEQANFLQQVYTLLQAQAPWVDRVFWFKYEDFGNGNWANWGLVRLRESDFVYGPEATPWPRKEAYAVYQSLANPGALPTARVAQPGDVGPRVLYFQETGHVLRDPFLKYWQDHGGLAQFGFPITEVFYVQGRAVQYFERARFEYWPEYTGTPYEVQLGLLGRYVTKGRSFATQPPPAKSEPNRTYFPQTGQYIANGFKDYWEKHGGLAIYGYPISPEIQEVNPAGGKTYTVQYFERARFEYHPEHKGTPFEVELGLLGNQVIAGNGWYR
jgi:hypothetical protein